MKTNVVFLPGWFMSTNHKDIGILYLFTSGFVGLIAVAFTVYMRMELKDPAGSVLSDNQHTPDAEMPVFAPSKRFDLELEMGAIVGKPSKGRVSVQEADDMIFGYVLLNDWSARDIQAWEYQPLGPFQAKATATTISPWIVTKDALERLPRLHPVARKRAFALSARTRPNAL